MTNHEDVQGMNIALSIAGALIESDDHPGTFYQGAMKLGTDAQILKLKEKKGTKDYADLSDSDFCSLVRVAYNDHPSEKPLYK